MKRYVLFMALPMTIIGCENRDSQQARLSQMCACMEKNKESFTNPLTAAAMGGYTNTTLATSTALVCAQQVLGAENSMGLETIQLFEEFQKTECGAQFGIDAASINKAESDARQALNNALPQQEEFVRDIPPAKSSVETGKRPVPLTIRKTSFFANGESSSDAFLANATTTYLVLFLNKTSPDWDGKNISFSIKVYDSAGNAVSGRGAPDGYFSEGNLDIDDSILPVESSSSTEMSNLFRLDFTKQGILEPGSYRLEIWCEGHRIYSTLFNII